MFVWFILGLVVIVAIYQLINRSDQVHQLATSDFHNYITQEANLFDGYLILDDEWITVKFAENYLPGIVRDMEEKAVVLPPKWSGEFLSLIHI